MKIYCATPMTGRSFGDVLEYYQNLTVFLKKVGFDVLCPMVCKTHLKAEQQLAAHGIKHPISTDHAIIERDRWMVQHSDVIYTNLLGANRVSIGSVMELAWAYDKGKHTIVVMEKDNIHQHSFVLEAADIVFEEESVALRYLEELVGGIMSYS